MGARGRARTDPGVQLGDGVTVSSRAALCTSSILLCSRPVCACVCICTYTCVRMCTLPQEKGRSLQGTLHPRPARCSCVWRRPGSPEQHRAADAGG